MKKLGFLLHIYQPPTQTKAILKKIVDECYLPLARLFLQETTCRFTVNMNYSLTELLVENGYFELLAMYREAAGLGRIEFTDSGAFHPILPLIPEDQVKRQLVLNKENNQAIMGENYQPKGVFPPEMAFSDTLIRPLSDLNYKWVITEDIPFNTCRGVTPGNFIATKSAFPVVFRSNMWSNHVSSGGKHGGDFVNDIVSGMYNWLGPRDSYTILAMDGETFGHHHKNYEEYFLRNMLRALENRPDAELCFISEIVDSFPHQEMDVPAGSWSTTSQDIWDNNPFPLWLCRFNHIHHIQWELTNLAIDCNSRLRNEELQAKLDKALHSCQYWWVSRYHWYPDMAFEGGKLLLEVIEDYARLTHDSNVAVQGKNIYKRLVEVISKVA